MSSQTTDSPLAASAAEARELVEVRWDFDEVAFVNRRRSMMKALVWEPSGTRYSRIAVPFALDNVFYQ